MKEIKKHFYKKYLTIGIGRDVDTGKVIFYQVFWNGTASKYKTKKQALMTGIHHIKNEIEMLVCHRECLLIQLSGYMQIHRTGNRKIAKITKKILEICEALAQIQNLIRGYNKSIIGLKEEIKKEEK